MVGHILCRPVRWGRVTALITVLLIGLPAWSRAYQIGYTSITFVDADRGGRQVPTQIYYPSDTAGEGVPVAPAPAGGFPVLVFGHGYMISWSDYGYLWKGLTPDGFVVALPKTGGELFPDHLTFGLDLSFVSRALRAESSSPASVFYGVLSTSAAIGGHLGGQGQDRL